MPFLVELNRQEELALSARNPYYGYLRDSFNEQRENTVVRLSLVTKHPQALVR